MASATKKTTVSGSFCVDNALPSSSSSSISRAAASAASAPVSASAGNAPQDWTVASTDHRDDQLGKEVAMASMICAVDSLPEPSANASSKGIPTMLRAQTSHPSRNYTAGETRGGVDRSDVKPLQIVQPEGLSFRVNGYFVEWQKWNFRIGFTPREGLVMYSVAYVDGSRGRRPVALRLSFVEMVVPYGDPNDPHYQKMPLMQGKMALEKMHSLKKGCDCLGYIKYFDAHFTNFTGGVETTEICVCLHGEDYGILWKHKTGELV